jgi:3-oxoacyl-[acyl-carrier protein] reductase
MRFSGKKVFITGASRGFGRAMAASFRAEGAWVMGTRVSPAGKDTTCDEWVCADFREVDQIERCANVLRSASPDILINNAGINKNAPFLDISAADFLALQRVNLFAPFRLCQAAIPAMKQKGWGRIVNVSSVWGKVSREQRAAYSASKFGLDGMTLALAAEHTADGILANCIAPGFADTELTRRTLDEAAIKALVSQVPARRLGQSEEIARLVLWLASTENTFIAGQNLAIDGGFTRV